MGQATAVSICSNALLLLGGQTISSFEDPVDRARICSGLYETVRDDLLRAHPWNCTIRRALLAPDAEPPAFGYSAQFQLPTDYLRLLAVGEGGLPIDYQLEGQTILADAASLELKYVYLNSTENTWDAGLVNLLTLAMAAALAYPITASASVQANFENKLAMAKKVARAIDGQENPPETLGDEHLYAARMGAFS